MYLTPTLKGFPLEFDIGARGQKSSNDGLSEGRKSFKIALVVYRHNTGCDGRTDGLTRRRSKDLAMLCVARVKIVVTELQSDRK